MADEAAHLRSVAERGAANSANPEGADPDESPVGERAERRERSDRPSDYQSHSDRRARSPEVGRVSRQAGECERGGDRAGTGGELARGSAVHAEAGTGGLRILPEADRRVRRAARAVSPADARPEPGSESAGREAERTTAEEGQESTVQLTHGLVSHHRDGSDPDRRN